MKEETDNSNNNDKIARKYFNNYIRMGGDFMGGGGFILHTGGDIFFRKDIGNVTIHPNGISVRVFKKEQANDIRKICEQIDKKETIKVKLTIRN